MIEIEILLKDVFRRESSTDAKISNERQDIYIVSKYLPIRYNGKLCNFIVKKPSRYHLNQVMKVNITSDETYQPHESVMYCTLQNN